MVSDVLMPGMTGLELAQQLVAKKPELRVVLTSGYSGDEFDHKELDRIGAVFVNKPVTQEALLTQIREVIGRVSA